ncbi:MAG: GNAT family N-acetyltransferase [Planctomycetaceae bacterium]|jgi:predicted TIM-barrel fold metal-dependent hydrolase/ribosomal protein S18 acetylase RimI-like enzyme|nr:GNAT family N-acetyltransferase [Planctomycetaceae bacterium]
MAVRIFDSHVHLGVLSHRERESSELPFDLYNGMIDFIKTMNKSGVERAIVFPIPHRDFHTGRSNDYIFEAYQKYPDRLISFCRIDDKLDENLRKGFKGAKLHLVYEDLKIRNIHTALKLLEDWNVPLLLHANFDKDNPQLKVQQVKEILSVTPNLLLILAHCGRGRICTDEQVVGNANALKTYDRIFFETSTVEDPQTANGSIVKAVCDIVGNERVLFGTDYPFQKDLYDYSALICPTLNATCLDTDTKQKIMFSNIYNLLNLGNEERVIIRRTNESDIDAVFDVFFSELSKQDKKYLAISAKLKYREHWERHITSGKSCFVAVLTRDTSQEKIVGYMRAFPTMMKEHQGDLWDFVVHPDYRKRGIAKQMLMYLHRRYSEMFAKTDANNVPMKTLLQSFGYQSENPDSVRIIKWNKK